MTWMDRETLSQNSGYNSKCSAFSHVTVASHQALQAVIPHVKNMAGVTEEEIGAKLWRALSAFNSAGSWEPFSVLEQRLFS